MKSAIMCPMPMGEKEFWEAVKEKLKKCNHPFLTAVEAARDEHEIHRNHIAGLQTRIGFTCFRLHGCLPNKMKTLPECRELIDEHIKAIPDELLP